MKILFRNEITHERLLELVEYDPISGIFINKVSRPKSPKGKVLGSKNASGHLVFQLDKVIYLAHRLAWYYVYKEWPNSTIDHIDRNPSNNSITNLRLANRSENSRNSKINSRNTSGIKGAFFDKRRNKYYSQIVFNGKKIWLGYYSSLEEAGKAYADKAKELHGDFINESALQQ